MRIACIRLDGMGDLIVTLPADQVFYNQDVTWFIPKGLEEICLSSEPKRQTISIPIHSNFKNFLTLYSALKILRPKIAVIYFAPWWAGLACFLARVPIRVGRLSQWWSYLFLNKGLRQSRSRSEKHELEYNFELSQFALNCLLTELPKSKEHTNIDHLGLILNPPPLRHLLEQHSLQPKQYIVVHPGMKGSALNWDKSNYLHLIQGLSCHTKVVVTGTKADSNWVVPLMRALSQNPKVTFFYDTLSLKELLYILKYARCVVAPSTGVAHLAASLGTRVIGLYPDLVAQSPKRWRPLGTNVHLLFSDQAHLSGITVAEVQSLCLA